MSASLEQQIREAVRQYIAGVIALRQFQEWFAPQTWDLPAAEGDEVRALVNEIDLLLAEFQNGHWTEQELRTKFQQYRSIVQPMADVAGALWKAVQAPYVYVAATGTRDGSGGTTYPGASLPAPSPRIEPSPLPA